MAWRRVHGPRAVDDGQHPVPRVSDQRRFVKRLPGFGTIAAIAATATVVVVVIVIEIVIVLVQIVVTRATAVLAFVRPTFGRHDRSLDAAAATQCPSRQLQQTLPGVLILMALQVVRATAPDRRRVCHEQRHDTQRQQAAAQPQSLV